MKVDMDVNFYDQNDNDNNLVSTLVKIVETNNNKLKNVINDLTISVKDNKIIYKKNTQTLMEADIYFIAKVKKHNLDNLTLNKINNENHQTFYFWKWAHLLKDKNKKLTDKDINKTQNIVNTLPEKLINGKKNFISTDDFILIILSYIFNLHNFENIYEIKNEKNETTCLYLLKNIKYYL